MGKFIKSNKVVLVLNGRYAGHKGIIVKNFDEGATDKPYGHALVAGIAKYPQKLTKKMTKRKLSLRSRIKTFVKVYNYNHLMPTRYSLDVGLDKNVVNRDAAKDPALKAKARKEVKAKLQDRYKNGRNRWFFRKLKF
ncbi:hypothetical protein LOTGIDRAFT_141455 [Lottia gigantea]|uniref:Large ribosomal subunit protein eL27 n=1 Tax=Lottia gigantea TaxID=225164 RepID=V4AXM4_LOTGI|nr:hypothetical protein LOTGIDRAFT_141455 [Lottia gigantea]ESO99795.1 hypothetical protein LOTGIDRAFT_141455 [Lottia gigantea]